MLSELLCTIELFIHNGDWHSEANQSCPSYAVMATSSHMEVYAFEKRVTIPLWSGWGMGDYVIAYTFGENRARIAGDETLGARWVDVKVEELQ